jgi:RimJ/RimL family protein N-acetyltransferase
MQLKTILADTNPKNLRSVNLLEKCGFVKTGKEDGEYSIYSLSVG